MIDSQGQRVEIPGDIVDSLNQQQAGINQVTGQQQRIKFTTTKTSTASDTATSNQASATSTKTC